MKRNSSLLKLVEWLRKRKLGNTLNSYMLRSIHPNIVEEETLQDYERRRKEEKVKNWKEKALHGEFIQQISNVAGEESWRWLRNGFLKKETEGLILAAQEPALRTNSIKYSIDKTSETPLCRF